MIHAVMVAVVVQDDAIRYAEGLDAALTSAREKGRAALLYFNQTG